MFWRKRTPVKHLQPDEVVGAYRIVEYIGEGDKGALYLAMQDDPEWTFWLLEMNHTEAEQEVELGKGQFEWEGKSYLPLPVAGTNALTLRGLVRVPTRSFIVPRWVHLTESVQYIHERGNSFQSRAPFTLEQVLFNGAALPSIPSFGAARGKAPTISAPEAANGTLTPASDVYVLGKALETMMTDPTAPNAPLTADRLTQAVLARATATNPDARYPDARAFALGLSSTLPRRKEAAGAVANTSDSGTPWISGCLIPLLLALLLGLGGWWWWQGRAQPVEPIGAMPLAPTTQPFFMIDPIGAQVDGAILTPSVEVQSQDPHQSQHRVRRESIFPERREGTARVGFSDGKTSVETGRNVVGQG